jgi:hypothetical protein
MTNIAVMRHFFVNGLFGANVMKQNKIIKCKNSTENNQQVFDFMNIFFVNQVL